MYTIHPTWKKIKNFSYGESREGWGLCNDGSKLFKSDGTEKIWFLDPTTLEEQGYIETVTNKSIFNKANELEYVDGKIYANVYQKESMMIIDATSGAIEGVINFGGLKGKVKKGPDWDDTNSVLNGVAYHPERETFFVTGKNWDKLFEVKIRRKKLMHSYSEVFAVTPNDLDELNHVNNIRYVEWIQDISKKHWLKVTDEATRSGMIWVVKNHQIAYHQSAKFGDTIQDTHLTLRKPRVPSQKGW